jgi:perosamine synthetase
MILVNEPLLNGNEKKYLGECIDTGWVSSDGPFVTRFEDDFSQYIGKKHGIAVANGTAALEVALYAAGVSEGDEVILPTFTIISCAIAVIRLGAIPILVDCEADTWNMNVSLVEEKISSKTKVIMPVHIYGHPVDMDPLMALAKQYNLLVIEDAAEVHGAEYKGRRCGSIGDLSSFSFYANKLITTGEGGMVLTDDDEYAARAKSYRNLCLNNQDRFTHHELGFNYRMTNIQAALGVAQLERIDEIVALKRELGMYYEHKLNAIDGIRFQIEKSWAKTVYWMYSIQLDESLSIDAKFVMQKLGDKGIGTRPFFRGLHDQPILKKLGLIDNEVFPIADAAYKFGLYLPSGMTLTKEQIDTVCIELNTVLVNR